jgi:HAE1 family hydrophobic/amphiphilic exporter-1
LNFDAVVDDPIAYDIVPTEEPETTVPVINADEAVATALANDPSIRQQRLGLQTAQLGLDSARNGLLPNLNLNASFNLQGRGGDRFIRSVNDLGAPVTEVQQTSFWTSQAQILSGDFNTWSVGANISFPLHNYSARAAHARASISERQSVTQLAQAEQGIVYTVRQNVRQVENLARQAEAATLSRELNFRQLEAEQRKFDVGTSTNFNVLTFQNQYSQAQVRELQAIISLQQALAQLEFNKGTLLDYFGVEIGQAGMGGGIR